MTEDGDSLEDFEDFFSTRSNTRPKTGSVLQLPQLSQPLTEEEELELLGNRLVSAPLEEVLITPSIEDREAAKDAILRSYVKLNPNKDFVRRYVERGNDAWLTAVLSLAEEGREKKVLGLYFEHYHITNVMFTERYKLADFAMRSIKSFGFVTRRVRSASQDGGKSVALLEMMPEQHDSEIQSRRSLSRTDLSRLYAAYDYRCAFCRTDKDISPDHRAPHRIAGNSEHDRLGIGAFQPACVVCNNEKQSACRRCPNASTKDIQTCLSCYYADPTGMYTHRAGTTGHFALLVATTLEEVAWLQAQRQRAEGLGTSLIKILK